MESGYHGPSAANPAAALHSQWQDSVPSLIHVQPGTNMPDGKLTDIECVGICVKCSKQYVCYKSSNKFQHPDSY